MEWLHPSPEPSQERREGLPSPTSTSRGPLQSTLIWASFWGQASLDQKSGSEEPVRITCDACRAPGPLANYQALLGEAHGFSLALQVQLQGHARLDGCQGEDRHGLPQPREKGDCLTYIVPPGCPLLHGWPYIGSVL